MQDEAPELGAASPPDLRQVCVHHPDRPAHALCMSCSRALCQECATTWDGINHCAACLAKRGRASRGRRSWPVLLLVLAAGAGLFWAGSRLMVWAGALAVSLL